MKKSPMRRYGKKTLKWDEVRKELKTEFFENGIVVCELLYDHCTRDNFLSWAHGKKRRHLLSGELKNLVILACQNCHQIIERLPEIEMCGIVEEVIRKRNLRLHRGGNDAR